MALITSDEVQAWLSTDRLQLLVTEDLPEESTVSNEVLARISAIGHDVSGWTDSSNTPATVKDVIALRVAAYRILKVYADQDEESMYANRLLRWADDILEGIIAGTVEMTEDPLDTDITTPLFFPTDTSSVDEPAKFSMSQEF